MPFILAKEMLYLSAEVWGSSVTPSYNHHAGNDTTRFYSHRKSGFFVFEDLDW